MQIPFDRDNPEYNQEKQKLKDQYESTLKEEKESGFRFECIFSSVISAFKKKTCKVIFNDTNKGMTVEKENALKRFPRIKKQGDFVIHKFGKLYEEKLGILIKETVEKQSPLELVKNLPQISSKVQTNISKVQKTLKKDISLILRNIDKRLKVFSHYMQNLYEREYCKTLAEKVLVNVFFMGVKFNFNRSLIKKENKNTKKSKLIRFLMNFLIKDIILLGENSEKVSLKELKKTFHKKYQHEGSEQSSLIQEAINKYVRENTEFGKNISEVEALIKQGKRVYFIMPHPGYLGALAPRHMLESFGFNDIEEKWTIVSGPRPFSNKIMALGAMTMGNIVITSVSSNTTLIKTPGLQRHLQLLALKSIKILSGKVDKVDWEEGEEILYNDLFGEDGEGGVIGIFPEGSRCEELKDEDKDEGSEEYLETKFCNPGMLGSIIDFDEGIDKYFVKMSQTGTENILRKGKKLPRRSEISFSISKPEKVTQEMINNKEETMCSMMEEISVQPSEKKIIFPFYYNKFTRKIERKDTVEIRKVAYKCIEKAEGFFIDIEKSEKQEKGQAMIETLRKYLKKPDTRKEEFEEVIQSLNDIIENFGVD